MAVDPFVEDVGADASKGVLIGLSRVHMTWHSNGCRTRARRWRLSDPRRLRLSAVSHAGIVVISFDAADNVTIPVRIWMVHTRKDDTN